MIEAGTQIVCKCTNTLTHNGYKQPLTIGNIYEIENVTHNFLSGIDCRIDYVIKGDNNNYTMMTEDKRYFYIWDYFYTTAEWRDKRIDEILEDD